MSNSSPRQIKIFYEKSPQYRTIHADGIWAGISPQGGIQLAFFTDLRPVPDYTVNEVMPDGRIGQEVDKLEKDGFIRESEVAVVLRPLVAEQLIKLLENMLDQTKKLQSSTLSE